MPETGYLALRFFLFSCLIFSTVYGNQYPVERVHSLLNTGISYLINSDYNSAENHFSTLASEFPHLPLGSIYLAAVEIIRGYDYGSGYNEQKINELLSSGKRKAENLLKQDNENPWNKYFLALALGYSAYYNTLKENWISAFTEGAEAMKIFSSCHTDSITFYESHTAIGNYLYWKSRKLESLNWLPFIEDETTEGIKLLQKASEKGIYSRYLAVYSLIWIYIDQKKYTEAAETAEEILKEYPESRLFKQGLARALEETDRREAIQIYYSILYSYSEISIKNEVELKHKIAQQYYNLGEKEPALKLCEEILSKKFEELSAEKDVTARLKRVKVLRNKLLL
jgi:tetratricopeptide (TPR) repeat protein